MTLNVNAFQGTDAAYWTGAAGTTWNASSGTGNFNTTASGSTAIALPVTGVTDVYFSSTAGSVANLSNTLGANTTINSLNFTGSGAVTIAADPNTLTINAMGVGNIGINDSSGTSQTINAAVALGGPQTWTNSGSGALIVAGSVANGGFLLTTAGTGATTISGNISGSGGLTNLGALTLAGSNSFAGVTNLNGGTLVIANSAALAGGGNITFGNGTLQFTSSNTLDYSGRIANSNGPISINTNSLTVSFSNALAASNVGGLTKLGTGTLVLAASNNFSGVTTIGAGVLQLGNGTTNGMVNGSIVDNATLAVQSAPGTTVTLSQPISGSGVLNVQGSGALALPGNYTYTGQTNVNAGTLIFTGTCTTTSKIFVGYNGAAGALIQNGGNFTTTATAGQDILALGSGANGYGFYGLNGGSLTTLQFGVVGNNGGANRTGVTDVKNGAALTVASGGGWLIWGWNNVGTTGTSPNGVLNIYNGTVTNNSTNDTSLAYSANETSQSALNLLGPGATMVATGGFNGKGINLAVSAGDTASYLNLDGGVLLTNYVKAGSTTPSYLGFNGGTLRANSANGAFVTGLTGAVLYSGGGTIDTNGYNVTSANGLLAPTGSGVTSIALSNSGAGYIGEPAVRITGGGGQGASAIAEVDLNPADSTCGEVMDIRVTSPGYGYTSSPTVTLIGGGATTVATVAGGTAGIAANAGGGLTKVGNGTLALNAASSFTGPLTINAGTVTLPGQTNNSFLTGNPNVVVNSGGVLSFTGYNSFGTTTSNMSAVTVNGGTILSSLTAAVYTELFNNLTLNNGTMTITGSDGYTNWGTFGFAGTTTVTGNSVINATPGTGTGTIGNSQGNSPTFTVLTPAASDTLTVSAVIKNDYNTESLVKQGNGLLVLSASNVYTGGTTISGGTLQLGDGVVNNGYLSGTSGIADQALLTFANPTAQTFAGAITGSGGLRKTAAGTLTLSGGSIAYTGATTVNSGRLFLPSGGSLANTAITVNPSGIFQPAVGTSGGSTGTGSAGATFTLNGGIFDMASDNAAGTFTLNQQSSFSGTSLNLSGGTLMLDLIGSSGTTGVDTLVVNSGSAAVSSPIDIALTKSGTLNYGTYPLIKLNGSGASGLAGNYFTLDNSGGTSETLNLGGQSYRLSLVNSASAESLLVAPGISSTLFTLAASIQPRMIVSTTAAFTGSITNSGSAGSDTLNYNLAASVASGSGSLGTLSNASGSGLALNATATAASVFTAGASPGIVTLNLAGTATNTTMGGPAIGASPVAASVDVLQNRTVTATPVAFGLVHAGAAVNGSFSLSTTGPDTQYTELRVDNGAPSNGLSVSGVTTTLFNNSGVVDNARTLGGTLSTAGSLNNTITLATHGESLPGENDLAVSLNYTAQVFSGSGRWLGTNGTTSWGGSASNNWTDANGSGVQAAPGVWGYSGDTATFNSVTGGTITLDTAAPSLSAINFSNSNGSYTIAQGSGGNTLTLNGSGSLSGMAAVAVSGTQTISAPILLSTSAAFVPDDSGQLILAGNVGDNGAGMALVLAATGVQGTGSLILGGTANSYSGGTYVESGTLYATNTGAIQDGSSLIVGAGGMFLYDPTAGGAANEPAISEKASDRLLAPVPEPGTLALLSVAGIVAAAAAWRRRRS